MNIIDHMCIRIIPHLSTQLSLTTLQKSTYTILPNTLLAAQTLLLQKEPPILLFIGTTYKIILPLNTPFSQWISSRTKFFTTYTSKYEQILRSPSYSGRRYKYYHRRPILLPRLALPLQTECHTTKQINQKPSYNTISRIILTDYNLTTDKPSSLNPTTQF